jgi:nitrate reductase assembly molybdenum cofactor insertion protein NarJ
MSTAEEYRQLAAANRLLAEKEPLPNVRKRLAESANRWEALACSLSRARDRSAHV